jgi:hypothetical protein
MDLIISKSDHEDVAFPFHFALCTLIINDFPFHKDHFFSIRRNPDIGYILSFEIIIDGEGPFILCMKKNPAPNNE